MAEEGVVEEEKGEGRPPAEDKSLKAQIIERLMDGASIDELVTAGYNKKSCQQYASELKKKYGREFGKGVAVSERPDKDVITGAKSMPLEHLVRLLKIPGGQRETLQDGMQLGMGLVILGVRVAQELSAIGVNQAKPLVEMARDMRAGEAAAAKAAATEAAYQTANALHSDLAPALNQIMEGQRLAAAGAAPGADPLRGMFVRLLEPTMQSMLGKVMSAMGGAPGPQGAPPPGQQPPGLLPEGWVYTKKEE